MNLESFNKKLEWFWWIMSILTTILVTVMVIIDGPDTWVVYYSLAVLCVLIALLRRFLGKRLAKGRAQQEAMQQQKKKS